MKNETLTLYKKVGRRYVKHDDYRDPSGLPCGLYLFYKPNYKGEHSAMMNMIHYAKVHDIQDVAKFSDLYVAHYEKIVDVVLNAVKKPFSSDELARDILSELSKIE